MTVYVMGAGASLHAKYPLGRNLLRKLVDWLDKDIDHSKLCDPEIKRIRQHYQHHLAKVQKLFPTLDNCEEILRELDSRAQKETGEVSDLNLPSLRDRLASGVREFFADIASREAATTYDLFAQIHANVGDLIITFNYDVALERALRIAGKWDIKDGYGFPFPFFPDAPSGICVLKLHGSVNWFQRPTQNDPPPLIARRDLDLLGYSNLTDPRVGEDGYPTDNLGTLILPDPNKKYSWEKLWQPLWKLAETKLASTRHLVIHGYSLPKSDCQPRKLLLGKTNHDASIEICCMGDSNAIADAFRNNGFDDVIPRPDITFQEWVAESPIE